MKNNNTDKVKKNKVVNEEELMNSSLVKSQKDIDDNIERKKGIENKLLETSLEKDVDNLITNTKNIVKPINVDVDEVNHDRPKVEVSIEDKYESKLNGDSKRVTQRKVGSKKSNDGVVYNFDFSQIPEYVQYDVIPLPSNGQCYPIDSPLRCGKVPVSYLTASDENLIASPNIYRDGKLIDIILGRKILDKNIKVSDLCSGDRDAIVLWLRATSYGDDFPISTVNPNTGKQYNVTLKLSSFQFYDFFLDGDDEGYFEYINQSNGDVFKFKFFTNEDDEKFKRIITSQVTDMTKLDLYNDIVKIENTLSWVDVTEEEKEMLTEDIGEIKEILAKDAPEVDESIYPTTVTEQMIMHTISINGKTDREYIKNYIENMRSRDAIEYRNYFLNNNPGVDFNFTVTIPESDGGGSFDTFLKITDSVFANF